jgi:hypothetical protein
VNSYVQDREKFLVLARNIIINLRVSHILGGGGVAFSTS